MRMRIICPKALLWLGATGSLLVLPVLTGQEPTSTPRTSTRPSQKADPSADPASLVVRPEPIPEFVHKSIEWLVEAQHESGGWGAGSHAQQEVRDPHAVPVDPATTAFVASALLRAGHTPVSGKYSQAVDKATRFLVSEIESYDKEGPRITDLQGTQPQSKLGQLIDTTMAAQYLARVLTTLPKDSELHRRVDKALEHCVRKLENAQNQDGSWNLASGWAPVLQSSFGCSSLEWAEAIGKRVDRSKLTNARRYQKGNFDGKTGQVRSEAAAGVDLYALSSSQRANAGEARAANDLINKAKMEGKLAQTAEVNADNLRQLGVKSEQAQVLAKADSDLKAQNAKLDDENLLQGFGNNGGEEYLSYMLTSESLVISGGEAWEKWNKKMHDRLAKVQSPDGSWSGHHCITSPVFCTAAAVQCLTADRDAKMLAKIARKAAEPTTTSTGKGESKPEEPKQDDK